MSLVDTTQNQSELAAQARQYLRDFPQYFEEAYQPVRQSTIRLGHPLLSEVEVSDASLGVEVTNFDVNWRNGILKLHNPVPLVNGIFVRGYHYEWFLDEDLNYFADVMIHEHMYDSSVDTFDQFSQTEIHVMAMGTVVQALWSLITEFSTQIDVSTPEGMMIPAHMRFQQTLQLFNYWKAKYDEMAAATNTGLNHISISVLRRISRMTGRYVPVFRERELDDPTYPVRLFPPIPEIIPSPEEGGPAPEWAYAGEAPTGWVDVGEAVNPVPPDPDGLPDGPAPVPFWNEGQWNQGVW